MRQILVTVALLLGFTAIGAIGFRITEGWDWLQCTYEAVIIMTTVGLSATQQAELQPATKMFIISYLLLGVGVVSYSIHQLGQHVMNLQWRVRREERLMEHALEQTSGHFIVCGYGRMGSTICQYLHQRRQPFVVIDSDAERIEAIARERGWKYLVGDATDDDVLRRAGIARAKALASTLPTDADNVYVVLSARLLNDRLMIIARASDEKAVQKMERAGATRVVSPFSSGAVRMARFMLHPAMEDFLEVSTGEGARFEIAEVQIGPQCPFLGRKLSETDLADKGVMIIGIRRADGEQLMPPPSSAVIQTGDNLFAFGSSSAVNEMISRYSGRE